MAFKPVGRWIAVVKVGFIVEGDCDRIMVESQQFRRWLHVECGLELVQPVVDATGGGNLLEPNLPQHVELLRKQSNPDKIVVIADLDPDTQVLCITKRKDLIGTVGIDLVLVAKTAIESWFLADTCAMQAITGNPQFIESNPEQHADSWARLKNVLVAETGRGPGPSKPIFAKNFVHRHGFDLSRAAAHPACPSAAYAVARLKSLAAT